MDIEEIRNKLRSGELIKDGEKIYTKDEWSKIEHADKQEAYYDLIQLTKKISLNSLYGALLNQYFRYGDKRLGSSTTGTGRKITTYMIETIGYLITGAEHTLIKTWTEEVKLGGSEHDRHEYGMAVYTIESDSIIYGDTDSCYYKTLATNKEDAIAIADESAEETNKSFPKFMRDAFNCQPGYDEFIKCGREVVASRGLFQAKKKYMLKVVDLEGVAVNKMKSMGSEIKKADTPKLIQSFLKETVDKLLDGIGYDELASFVNEERLRILKNPDNVFLLGVAKQVNNLQRYTDAYNNNGIGLDKDGVLKKITIPGHARAAINYNTLIQDIEQGAKRIETGNKIIVYYLKPNQYKLESIAFPSDFSKFPNWFKDTFEVDIKKTEEKMFDNKLGGIFAAIGRVVPTPQSVYVARKFKF